MALAMYLGSITESKKLVDGNYITGSFDVFVYLADDQAQDIQLGNKTVHVEAEGKTPAELRIELKDLLRPWWQEEEAQQARQATLETHATTAINELIAEA